MRIAISVFMLAEAAIAASAAWRVAHGHLLSQAWQASTLVLLMSNCLGLALVVLFAGPGKKGPS